MEHILIGIVVLAAFAALIWQAYLHRSTLLPLAAQTPAAAAQPPAPAPVPVVINNHVNATPPVSAPPPAAVAPASSDSRSGDPRFISAPLPDGLPIFVLGSPTPGLANNASQQDVIDYNALTAGQKAYLKVHVPEWFPAFSPGDFNLERAVGLTKLFIKA